MEVGFDARSHAEFTKFQRYFHGSSSEIQNLPFIILDRSFITQETLDSLHSQAAFTHSTVSGFI
ncbi:MAG: four helix bundle protein [Pirellulaceae bacterium]